MIFLKLKLKKKFTRVLFPLSGLNPPRLSISWFFSGSIFHRFLTYSVLPEADSLDCNMQLGSHRMEETDTVLDAPLFPFLIIVLAVAAFVVQAPLPETYLITAAGRAGGSKNADSEGSSLRARYCPPAPLPGSPPPLPTPAAPAIGGTCCVELTTRGAWERPRLGREGGLSPPLCPAV